MNTANLSKKSKPSNREIREARKLKEIRERSDKVKDFTTRLDRLEKVLEILSLDHISVNDHLLVALKDPAIYHALNHLFENPLHYYHCFNNAFHHLQFSEMVQDLKTPWGDVVRAFAEVKDSLLNAHLNTVNSIH